MNKAINNNLAANFFKSMAEMVDSTSMALDMINNTPKVHNYDFTLTAVRELLEAINETSFHLMLKYVNKDGQISLAQDNQIHAALHTN